MNADELLDRVLRELPLRRAPHTLEARVLGELERRAARPWWCRSFTHWPNIARLGFLVICAVPALAITGAAGNIAATLVGIVPAWIYLGLAAAAFLYACLFGLGAAAYRLLYLQPLNVR
jgi:hypothetical protein